MAPPLPPQQPPELLACGALRSCVSRAWSRRRAAAAAVSASAIPRPLLRAPQSPSPSRPAMWSAALVAVLAAGAVLVPAAAQSTLYSDDGCRITAFGPEVNVTCTCDQKLRQTASSVPIKHLDIRGCLADDPRDEQETRLTFLPPAGAADKYDFVLLQVRSVNVSQSRLRLTPVGGSSAAAGHPLRRLHIELGPLTRGLPSGTFQGLPNLESVSLDLVTSERPAVRSALADLPRLEELYITNSHFRFVNTGTVTRTPRLRRLRFSNSKFDYMGSDAIAVESDDIDDEVEGSGNDDSFLEFSDMIVNTMNTNAVRAGAVHRLLVSNNSIGVMYSGALNVTLRAPAEDRPLFRFTTNTLTDVRGEAVAVENDSPTQAILEVGGNILLNSALSPHELRLQGTFERRPVAGLRPDQFDCSCCECPGSRQLIEVALQSRPSQLETETFVAMLGRAHCVGGTEGSFLRFASGCAPDADLTARVASLVSLPHTTPTPPSAAWRPAAGPVALLPMLALALAAAGRG